MNSTAIEYYRLIYLLPTNLLISVSTVGIIGNTILFLATVKNKSLRSPCNIMIGMLAFSDVVHQMTHVLFVYDIFFGGVIRTIQNCFWLIIFNEFFQLFSCPLQLVIGLDRLCGCLYPAEYLQRTTSGKYIYIGLMSIFPTVYALTNLVIAYFSMMEDPTSEVICIVPAFFTGTATDVWSFSTVVTNICIFIVYFAIWIIVYRKQNIKNSFKLSMKPLTCIIVATILGWFMGLLLILIQSKMDLPVEKVLSLYIYDGMFVHSAIALNIFFYMFFRYLCRKRLNIFSDFRAEYRHAIKRLLHLENKVDTMPASIQRTH